MKLNVNEIFYSIQGEGIHQGLPTVFVRLQGCNLRPCCTYCDTEYAQEDGGYWLTIKEVIARIVSLSPSTGTRVCITGGEPLLQEEALKDLVAHLNRFRYALEVFSNGSLPKPDWWTRVHSWVIDIKAPSSGVTSLYAPSWFNSRVTDQIKLTVGTPEDLHFANEVVNACATMSPQVIVSPITFILANKEKGTIEEYWSKAWLQEVVEFCLKREVRLSLQWQKIVWGNKRGV